MANPSLEEEGILQEWAPLENLLQQIPLKAQKGLFTHDLNLTCVDVVPEFIAVGTNFGLVYWYDRRKGDLKKLPFENTGSAITCVKVISTVDYMVAAGNDQGIVTVFQIPKIPPDTIPESMKPKKSKQVDRYTISGSHTSSVTAIEWNMNGMKLFSGDKNGLVVITEIDFNMHLSKSSELMNEKYEIVQLSYCQQFLLVSTVFRSILCHREERWKVVQVGQKERKMLGKLGATLCVGSGRPQELVVYASRPGLRIWLSDKNGVVQQTLIFRDALGRPHHNVPLINPVPKHIRQQRSDHQFGQLFTYRDSLLVTYNSETVYILNPCDISVIATVADLRRVQGVAVCKDEIFILEGGRSLVRVAYMPDNQPISQIQGTKIDNHQDSTFMSIPVSLPDISMNSLLDFTSKIKGSAVVPAIPFNRINPFNKSEDKNKESLKSETLNPIVTADEALELPPVQVLPADFSVLTSLKLNREDLRTSPDKIEEGKTYKEYYNHSQRDCHRIPPDSSRVELLEKIGELKFEEVLYKPPTRKKCTKKKATNKFLSVSGVESGSDSMSTSTNSVLSTNSDSDDLPCNEKVCSCDLQNCKESSSIARCNLDSHSSSEDTLTKLNESVTNDNGSCSVSVNSELINELCLDNDERTGLDFQFDAKCDPQFCQEFVQPDLRSPESIERDVVNKERMLAKVLNLDILLPGVIEDLKQNKESTQLNTQISVPSISRPIEEHHTFGGPSFDMESIVEDGIACENVCEEDKPLYGSVVLNYGPPSGSSAPPSNQASLELEPHSLEIALFETTEQETADKWLQYKTPSSVMSLSVCQHYICCIDSRDSIYFSTFNGLGLKWQKLDNKGRQVAMSQDGNLVWKIHKNVMYALKRPSYKGPFGNGWTEAARDVQSIAMSDETGWFISLDGRIYIQKHLSRDNPCSESLPVHCLLPATRISCFRNTVWILTTTGEVWWRDGVTAALPEGTEWKIVRLPSTIIVDIALGCQETGWVVDNKNLTYFSTDFSDSCPQWWQVLLSDYVFQDETTLEQFRSKLTDNYLSNLRPQSTIIVSSAEDKLWISEKMATNVHMNKTEFIGHQWKNITLTYLPPGTKWLQVCAGGMFEDTGHLWLLSKDGFLYNLLANSRNVYPKLKELLLSQPLPVPGSSHLTSISATHRVLCALSSSGEIFTYYNIWKPLNLPQSGSQIIHISCGSDAIWMCDNRGEIFMAAVGENSFSGSIVKLDWKEISDKPPNKCHFVKVYIDPLASMVWALDSKRKVYVREGIFPDFLSGTGWVPVSGTEAVALTVSGTAVWALHPSGQIYRRYGVTQSNYVGDYWKRIPGCVSALTASLNDDLWALNKKGDLIYHEQCAVQLSAQSPRPKLQKEDVAGSLKDWEFI